MWIDAVGPIHAAAVSPISLFFFTAINRAWQEKCQLHCHQVSLVRVPNHYYILHDSWFLLQITNLIEGLHVTAQLECMQSADNQRRIFTTIAQSYIINIMSVNSWWNPVFKQICGEKTFQELRMLSPAWLALGLRMGAIAEFLHDPHPTPPPPPKNSCVISVLVHMPPGHLLLNILWYLRPIFRTFAALFF